MDIEVRLLELEATVKNLIKCGVVESFNAENGTAKVVFKDISIKSYDLPIMVKQTLKNKDYWIPDIGEPVICIFLPTGIESGFILGSYYNKKNLVPATDQNKRVIKFEDGSYIEYDRQAHKLIGDIKGDIDIKATGKIDILAEGEINITTNSKATVTANESIDILANTDVNIDAKGLANVKAVGILTAESTASIDLKAPVINLVTSALAMAASGGGSASMTMSGNIELDGTMNATGDINVGQVISSGINLTTHTHAVSGSSTGGPQ